MSKALTIAGDRHANELLQRAVELHHMEKNSLSMDEIQQIASELGLPMQVVQVAYRDLEVGAIIKQKTAAPVLGRLLGPGHTVLTRQIFGPRKEHLKARIQSYLEGQLFRVVRVQGDQLTFVANDRAGDSLRRVVDLKNRFEITASLELDAFVWDIEGGVEVALVASFSRTRREAAWASGVGTTLAVIAGAVVGGLFASWAYPVAAIMALGAWALGRGSLRSEMDKTSRALEYLLDQMEPSAPPPRGA